LKPIKLGVVGLGRAFMLMLPTFIKDPRIKLVAAAARNQTQLNLFKDEFKGSDVGDLDSLCKNKHVEAVYIATPHEIHLEQILKLLTANKHILVEKPMTLSVEQAKIVINAIKQSKADLIVGPSHSFDAPIIEAAKVITSKRYGDIKMISAQYYTDFVYRPRRPEELDSNLGGGAIFNQGAHHADILLSLANSRAISVYGCAGNFDKNRPCDGAYTAIVKFKNNCIANITYSGYAHYDTDSEFGWVSEMGTLKDKSNHGLARNKLVGVNEVQERLEKSNKGYHKNYLLPDAEFNEHFGKIIISCEGADIIPTPTGMKICANDEVSFIPISKLAVPRSTVIDELYQLVRNNVAPIHDANRALNNIALCEAISISSIEKRQITIKQ